MLISTMDVSFCSLPWTPVTYSRSRSSPFLLPPLTTPHPPPPHPPGISVFILVLTEILTYRTVLNYVRGTSIPVFVPPPPPPIPAIVTQRHRGCRRSSRLIPCYCLKLCHGNFIPHTIKQVIHNSAGYLPVFGLIYLRCSVCSKLEINPLNAKLNPICHLLALLGAHHILHVSRIRVKSHLPSAGIIRSSPYSPR